jgi:hypothetical protein
MTKQPNTAKIRLQHKSEASGFFIGNQFSVLHDGGTVDISYNSDVIIAKQIGDSAVILYRNDAKYVSSFDAVSKSVSKTLHHKGKLMVSVVDQNEAGTSPFYTIIIDKFDPINNLYVNTESK